MTEEKLSKKELLEILDSWLKDMKAMFIDYKDDKLAYNPIKALIKGKVSDEFVEEKADDFQWELYDGEEDKEGNPIIAGPSIKKLSKLIKQLLEDYHKELMK